MKLLQHLIIILIFLVSIIFGIWFAPGPYAHDLAAIVNKRDILISKPAPRLIFIGGSSLTTMNSRYIENSINRKLNTHYSVINLGLWGGLNMKSYLDEIKMYLSTGDILIICQEYATLLDKNYFNFIKTNEESKKFFFLLSPKKHSISFIKEGDFFAVLKNIILLNQLKLKSFIGNIFNRKHDRILKKGFHRFHEDYNLYGDRIKPFKIKRPLNSDGVIFDYPDIKKLSYINMISQLSVHKKFKVVFMYPPFPESQYKLNINQINSLNTIFKTDFKIPLLNSPTDTIFPNEYFADTVNHLKPSGEILRTKLLIRRLAMLLSAN